MCNFTLLTEPSERHEELENREKVLRVSSPPAAFSMARALCTREKEITGNTEVTCGLIDRQSAALRMAV